MAKGTVEKRDLTEDEIADAKRLELAWKKFKTTHPQATQKWLAVHTGLGKTQSSAGQYIKGHIQLNEKAVLAFANVFGIAPQEISPRMKFPAISIKSDGARELVTLFEQASPESKERMLRYARFEINQE